MQRYSSWPAMREYFIPVPGLLRAGELYLAIWDSDVHLDDQVLIVLVDTRPGEFDFRALGGNNWPCCLDDRCHTALYGPEADFGRHDVKRMKRMKCVSLFHAWECCVLRAPGMDFLARRPLYAFLLRCDVDDMDKPLSKLTFRFFETTGGMVGINARPNHRLRQGAVADEVGRKKTSMFDIRQEFRHVFIQSALLEFYARLPLQRVGGTNAAISRAARGTEEGEHRFLKDYISKFSKFLDSHYGSFLTTSDSYSDCCVRGSDTVILSEALFQWWFTKMTEGLKNWGEFFMSGVEVQQVAVKTAFAMVQLGEEIRRLTTFCYRINKSRNLAV
jgi:hypothetical protein